MQAIPHWALGSERRLKPNMKQLHLHAVHGCKASSACPELAPARGAEHQKPDIGFPIGRLGWKSQDCGEERCRSNAGSDTGLSICFMQLLQYKEENSL